MCDQQRLRPAFAYAQSDQSLCKSFVYFMTVKLLTEHHLEFLSITGGCTGLSESTLVKLPHCCKSHAAAQFIFQQGGSHSCQSSPEVPSPWQQNSLPTSPIGYQGNNNNLNYLPCSSQCDNSRNQNLDSRFSVQAYAVRHGLNEQDFRGYDPDLKDSENPHYYHINSILYNAHLEKAKRYGTEYVYKGT